MEGGRSDPSPLWFGSNRRSACSFKAIEDNRGQAKTKMVRARDVKEIIERIYQNAGGRELLADHEPLERSLYEGIDTDES